MELNASNSLRLSFKLKQDSWCTYNVMFLSSSNWSYGKFFSTVCSIFFEGRLECDSMVIWCDVYCRKNHYSKDIGRQTSGRTPHGPCARKISLSRYDFDIVGRSVVSWRRGDAFTSSFYLEGITTSIIYYVDMLLCYTDICNAKFFTSLCCWVV